MSDLIARLRNGHKVKGIHNLDALMQQAADVIERLERQHDKALAIPPAPPWLEGSAAHNHALYLMRQALTDTEASDDAR